MIFDRLTSLRNLDGGWPYEPGQRSSFCEPTCWALLALNAAGRLKDDLAGSGCTFLRSLQLDGGGFCGGTVNREANWSTSLAIFCLATLGRESEAVRRGVDWLLGFEGAHWRNRPDSYFAHDTSIRGWPWLAGCHSWIEPTCYAIYAFRTVGQGDHPRVAEASRMLGNRALPAGGWNYGNTKVLGTELRPFPSTTGTALIALWGTGYDEETDRGLGYLGRALPRLRTAWALGWAVLAARCFGLNALRMSEPVDVNAAVEQCLERQLKPKARVRVHELAVLATSSLDRDRLPFPELDGSGVRAGSAGVEVGW